MELFYEFLIFMGLDPNLSFVEAAIALWEWEEESSPEKISFLYSLHSLDYSDINSYFIWYLITWL